MFSMSLFSILFYQLCYCFCFLGDGDEDIVQEVPEEEDEEKKPSLSKGERSHLIVWEVSLPH